MAIGNSEALVLEPLQNQLHSALKAKSETLARMYFSALQVFSQAGNLDRFYLTAHAIREMMGKLPDVIDVPIEEGAKQRLSDFVNNVGSEWAKMCSKGRWPGDPRWQGDLDKDLNKFLQKIEVMLEAGVKIKKSRKALVQSVLRKQNFSSVPLPIDIEDLTAKKWITYQDYFTTTAHYNPTDEATFLSYLKHFERFLLDCLEPRTFDVQDDIKKIIEEGESNAN
jgi:hypothetical protein